MAADGYRIVKYLVEVEIPEDTVGPPESWERMIEETVEELFSNNLDVECGINVGRT